MHFSTKNSVLVQKFLYFAIPLLIFSQRDVQMKWFFFPFTKQLCWKRVKKQPNALSTNDPIFHNHWNWKLQLHSYCYLWQHRQTWHLLYYTNDKSLSFSHAHTLTYTLVKLLLVANVLNSWYWKIPIAKFYLYLVKLCTHIWCTCFLQGYSINKIVFQNHHDW